VLDYADFFALMPGDNSATVAAGTAIEFPQDGPITGGIRRVSASQFLLPDIGTYLVNWQASISEPAQLVLGLNSGSGITQLLSTVVGRSTGQNQIYGSRVIKTSVVNSILSVLNPIGALAALTITPNAGGVNSVSASLVILQLS
jgi:hypothetical protein